MEVDGGQCRGEVIQRMGGGGGCRKFVPVLGGNGTKIAPLGDMFDQPPGAIN